MDTLKRISGIFLVLMAVAVAVHTVVEPLYHTSSKGQPYSPLWDILDPLMALAIALGVIFGYLRKKAADSEGDSGAVTREFVAANAQFYGFLFVGILFFWNWFILLSPAFTAVGAETASLVWILIDATLPLLTGAMGVFLLRGGSDG